MFCLLQEQLSDAIEVDISVHFVGKYSTPAELSSQLTVNCALLDGNRTLRWFQPPENNWVDKLVNGNRRSRRNPFRKSRMIYAPRPSVDILITNTDEIPSTISQTSSMSSSRLLHVRSGLIQRPQQHDPRSTKKLCFDADVVR